MILNEQMNKFLFWKKANSGEQIATLKQFVKVNFKQKWMNEIEIIKVDAMLLHTKEILYANRIGMDKVKKLNANWPNLDNQ